MNGFVKFLTCATCCIAAISAVQHASGQQTTLKKEDIPRIPTDTMTTDRGEVRIVTFSDGTFRFIPTNPFHFMSSPAYETHWDTLNIFAYRGVELRDLPERTTVEFAEAHGFRAPATGKILSKYGPRGRRDHNGTDIRVTHGQPVYAAFDGVVRLSRWNSGGFGNIVVIRHPNGLETYYAHLSRRAVVADEWVRAGQVIGYGGRTGRATTDHLHFEVRLTDQSFDPERIIDFTTGSLRRRTFALRKDYFNIRSRSSDADYAETSDAEGAVPADSVGLSAAIDPLVAESADGAAGEATVSRTESTDATAQQTRPEPVYYKIVSGDTLLALALHYKTTVAKICNLNGMTRTSTLRIGRNLRIK